MKKQFLPIFAALVLVLASCGTEKKIVYFQDLTDTTTTITGVKNIVLQPQDQISIVVSCKDPEIAALFNLTRFQIRAGAADLRSSYNNGDIAGYTLDANGNIDFPQVGLLHVASLTKSEVAALVKNTLIERELVKDPVVTVEFMNLYYSVLGEIKTPGRYAISKDHMTILEALSTAGDLTITGRRDNIQVIREINGVRNTYAVDMRSKDIFNSPVYYIQQNDVIYIEPNKMRVGQSTINENSIKSVSMWVSISSFLVTLATMTVNIVNLKRR